MAIARKRQISLADTKYYHCISRCVRRAYLCGEDPFTGQNYAHRRGWVKDKLISLAKVFCIDVCAYAVMSNHTHIVLYVDDKKANRLNDKAIAIRWHKLFKGTAITHKFIRGEKLSATEHWFLNESLKLYRERLSSISWFMRALNENIARRANKEDGCTGRFWEGRFKSQALLDEAALLACMAYVDLNPIRSKAAATPEGSHFTSVKQRIKSIALKSNQALKVKQPKQLLRFAGKPKKYMPKGLPFELKTYLELVELTGRCIRADKIGFITHSTPELLIRLNIAPENWLKLTIEFGNVFHGAVGRVSSLDSYCKHQAIKRRPSYSNSKKLIA